MAPAARSNGNMTPGRRGKRGNENQYFEPGKVGRKTGITLKDTGVRDEHGLEPVSGIFSSSPSSVQRHGSVSEDMDVQESSAPDVTTTLGLRKTPRLPIARQSTPRHTNIGTPRRASSARPGSQRGQSLFGREGSARAISHEPTNRVLNFTGAQNRNRKSIHVADNSLSPFKPKKALRRSNGPIRPDPFDIEQDDTSAHGDEDIEDNEEDENAEDEDAEGPLEDLEQNDDAPIMDNDDFYEANEQLLEPVDEEVEDEAVDEVEEEEAQAAAIGSSSRGQKRDRTSLQSQLAEDDAEPEVHFEEPLKKKRGRPRKSGEVAVHTGDGVETIDPSLLAYGDQYLEDDPNLPDEQPVDEEPVEDSNADEARESSKGSKGRKAGKKQRNTKKTVRANGSPVKLNGSPAKAPQRGGSVGPISNVNLRAATPFEDAGQHASRFGRNLIKPLKYWENEARIYKNGDIEGIIRAERVEFIRPAKNKKRRKGRQRARDLDDIEEVSDSESLIPSDWEDEHGVLTYTVAGWIPEIGKPDLDEPVEEDLVFAQPAIVTKDVAGSDFRYAKIMTLPFFGAGLVELPPGGFKRAKNSRAMQMAFFVHEGKVTVDVGGQGMEINQFSISKGGVWIVPRGNNYSIANLSTTKTAKLFFAQGCEKTVEPVEQ